MRFARRLSVGIAALAVAALPSTPARAQQIKSRVMVMIDNSGSMGMHFKDANPLSPPPSGDYPGGDGSTSYTDANVANQPWYPGKLLGNGTRDGVNSRMYAAKSALANALNAYAGDIDFGLATYDFSFCAFNQPQCFQCLLAYCAGNNCFVCGGNKQPACNAYNCLYTDPGFTALGKINTQPAACPGQPGGGNGGKILAVPDTGSATQVMPWIDGVEVFKNNGSGQPLNPEMRANGATPLAGSITYIQKNWYDPIKNAAQGTANYDPQLSCRPYVAVIETDGGESCGQDPISAAQALYQDNPQNPVLVYVIGLAADATLQMTLNQMAQAGGTGQARFANSQTDIEAAYADILAKSIKVEACNNKDDNCNGQVDEGFDKGAACSVGVGACLRTGIKKCDPNNNTQTTCCVNDGNPNGPCTPLMPGAPSMEICDGIDNNCNGIVDDGNICAINKCVPETCNGKDDDCDGIVDNHLVDVGQACGLNLGICKPGTTVCENSKNQDVTNGGTPDAGDRIVCQGGVQAQMETCNNLDDDCDGVVDGMSQACYDGPMGTDGVGICHGGLEKCTAGAWGACVGEVKPQAEICNGIDDDCDGMVDDNITATVNGMVVKVGDPCCPSGKCGMGICKAGTYQCSGGALQCVGGQGPAGEICNGLDDDCNGQVDDLASLGKPCVAGNGCSGTLVCDTQKMMVVCQSAQMNCGPMTCANDPMVGKPCGPYVGLPGPCMPGTYQCDNDKLTCTGGVGPMPEACNCKDDDCNGKIDDNAFCPMGTDCVSYSGACGCYGKCGGGEFPCPVGYDCIDVVKKMACDSPGDPNVPCYCLPEQTCDPPCAADENCVQQPPPATKGMCVSKCAGVMCPPGSQCKNGQCLSCVEDPSMCKACANGMGERCDTSARKCVPDLCCGVTCGANETCQPLTGQCTKSCANVNCSSDQICVDGACVDNKCKGVMCPEGKTCDPSSGMCVSDVCRSKTCQAGQACCMGGCTSDPCAAVQCATGFKCTVNTLNCNVSCDQPVVPESQQDKVVGAGGGGYPFGCTVGTGRAGSSGGGSLAFLAMALASLLVVRRRRR